MWHGERVWQDIVPLVALILATWAVAGTQSDLERQREGRVVALDVLCGFANGVSEAGREVILGPEGAPDQDERRKLAEQYTTTITNAVVAQAGAKAESVVNGVGTVDCNRLRVVAKATDRIDE